jgi:hypothetical protein
MSALGHQSGGAGHDDVRDKTVRARAHHRGLHGERDPLVDRAD